LRSNADPAFRDLLAKHLGPAASGEYWRFSVAENPEEQQMPKRAFLKR
jgi:hypothetical protein